MLTLILGRRLNQRPLIKDSRAAMTNHSGTQRRPFLAFALLALVLMLLLQYLLAVADPTQNNLLAPGSDASRNAQLQFKQGFWIDSGQQQKLDGVLKQSQIWLQRDFEQVPWRFSPQAYWLRLELHNSGSQAQALALYFANPMLEQLSIYRALPDGGFEALNLGWQEPKLSREQRALPSYSLSLAPSASEQLFIRIQTEGIAKTPIQVYRQSDFAQLKQLSFLIWGSFVGVLVVMSLYNLVLYRGLNDTVYLAYIAYILSVLAMLGVVIGFGHYIWPAGLLAWMRSSLVTFNLAVVICALVFALLFFKQLGSRSKIERICMRYLQLLLLLAFSSLFLPEYLAAPLFFVAMSALYPILGIFLYQQYQLKHPWASYYLVSWVPIVVAGALQPMVLIGVIESSFLLHHSLMIGVLIEIVLMAMALASRMQHKRAQALYNAGHDYRTRLPNAPFIEARMANLEQQQQPFALCLIEVDEFGLLQPYLGAAETDDLMLLIAEVINSAVLDCEQVAALEQARAKRQKVACIRDGVFALLVTADRPQALAQCFALMQQELVQRASIGGLELSLDLRFGLSLFQVHLVGAERDAMKQAQQALAMAQQESSSVQYYHAEQRVGSEKKLSLAASLQRALRNNELALYHQPQINLNTGVVEGTEVLLRWLDSQHGFVPPNEFIPVAEDTGIINELTLWVIEQACVDLLRLVELGYTSHKVSINISGKDIAEADFLDQVKPILQHYRVPLNNLTFELTETVTVSDFHLLKKTMAELRSMGVNIAIDDYGTGYSSLFYLSQLPFSELKIDKSFVLDLDVSSRHRTIVTTTLEMAKSLDLRVVAEGVESAAVASTLAAQGCHVAQGYHYQRPQPLAEYIQWLDRLEQGRYA